MERDHEVEDLIENFKHSYTIFRLYTTLCNSSNAILMHVVFMEKYISSL